MHYGADVRGPEGITPAQAEKKTVPNESGP
jgi:hypothetical protein